jgi:K+-sensing histidine kinase KdpD
MDDFPICEDKVDSIIERINEIITKLHCEFKNGFIDTNVPIPFNQKAFSDLMEVTVIKLQKIYYEASIIYRESFDVWNDGEFISIEKELLYQVLENAVENSCHAKATEIKLSLVREQNQIILQVSDNGDGIKIKKNTNRIFPEGTGTEIIKENLNQMGAKSEYTPNPDGGITLSLMFPTLV